MQLKAVKWTHELRLALLPFRLAGASAAYIKSSSLRLNFQHENSVMACLHADFAPLWLCGHVVALLKCHPPPPPAPRTESSLIHSTCDIIVMLQSWHKVIVVAVFRYNPDKVFINVVLINIQVCNLTTVLSHLMTWNQKQQTFPFSCHALWSECSHALLQERKSFKCCMRKSCKLNSSRSVDNRVWNWYLILCVP